MSSEEVVLPTQYWFVGAFYADKEPQDQTQRFFTEGIWENGFEDRHLETVKSMRPGDRIAIKSSYVRKHGVPFDTRGHMVSTMVIKATGRITRNHGDGRRVDVDWNPVREPREWYFYTGRATIWKVLPGDWMPDALIQFAFDGEQQDIDRFRNVAAWAKRFGDEDPAPQENFAWTTFYEELATALLSYRDRRDELLSALNDLQASHDVLGYLTDKDENGEYLPLDDICPFTIFGTFNRGITNAKRTALAADWAKVLGVTTPAPTGFQSIPLLNNQNSWFFSYKPERSEGDIDALWDVFEAALALADSNEDVSRMRFAKAYDPARRIHGVGGKLSMGLFWARPWNFLPLDGQSRSYLKTVLMLDGNLFQANGSQYLSILDTLISKFDDPEYPVHSFPELSWNAFLDPAAPIEPTDNADETTTELAPAFSLKPYSIADIVADGCFVPHSELNDIINRWRSKKNIILQGPPGTGKTWLARRLAYALIGSNDLKSAIRAVQFHPNMSYEDFVRGWRPGSDGKLRLVDGPFLEMVDRANAAPDVPHVVLVEEINRGNPVQVFGELLTLIEAGKRSPREALHLAYTRDSDDTVHVPSNLYIIGTMNLADRSLAIMDLAFRRRFGFIPLSPSLNQHWIDWMSSKHDVDIAQLEAVRDRFEALNASIENDSTLGPEFMLGHSFVTPPADERVDSYFDWFQVVVETEIAPTLKEYWFDAPTKVDEEVQRLVDGLI
ncbi:McrB family protein [Arthrobacter sp. AFG20]|uniref:McrB family protein n=1 Tax=Arthrobacter sp. AFG20 TaxID=1688671 RepID=UPI000C9EC2F1|nr:AAA family ATPase [Arthrobacter sp. AFG20]PNH86098.1 AAA family ATPase [Arthrobacter sp. AFG20]